MAKKKITEEEVELEEETTEEEAQELIDRRKLREENGR